MFSQCAAAVAGALRFAACIHFVRRVSGAPDNLKGVLMKKLGILLVLGAGLALPQAAAAAPYTATLAKPLSAVKEVIVNSTIFRCEGTACATTSRTDGMWSVRACHKLMQKAGTITAYGTEGKSFDADQLKSCNATD
jgi:hypothetical protein